MSLLPPIVAELRGNITDFQSKMRTAGEQFSTTTATMEEKSKLSQQRIGAAFAAGGVAVTGIGAGLQHLGHDRETQEKALEVAIKNTGKSYDDYAGQIASTQKAQEHFAHSNSDTDQALAILVRATGDTKLALSDMDLVTQLAAVHHSSLADAANQVAKMHGGATRALKEFGINTKDNQKATAELAAAEKASTSTGDALVKAKAHLGDVEATLAGKTKLTTSEQITLRKAHEAVTTATAKNDQAVAHLKDAQNAGAKAMDFATEKALILAKTHGTAESHANTFGGKMEFLRTKMTDYAAVIGTKVGPALTLLGPMLLGVSGIITTGVVPAMASAALAAAPWIISIGLVIAAGYLLYKNWDTITGFIKRIVGDAFDWVKQHFDLLAIVLTGPFAPLLLLAHHFSDVFDTIKSVVGAGFRFIAETFLGIIGGIVDGAARAFGWVPGLGGKLKSAASAFDSFRDGVNASLDGINDKHVSVTVDLKPTVAAAKALAGNLHFDKGGFVPGPKGAAQFAVVHGGEFVVSNDMQRDMGMSPSASPAVAPSGGNTIIVNVNVSQAIGSDLRAAGEQLAKPVRDELIRQGYAQRLGFSN